MNQGGSKITVIRHALPPGTPSDTVRAILRSRFAGSLPARDLDAILAMSEPAIYTHRETILSSDTPEDRLLIIFRGHAKEHRVATDGHEIILAVMGPGDLIGGLTVIDGPPAIASVTSLDRVEALAVPGADLRRFLTSSPVGATAFLRQLAQELRMERSERVEATAHDSRVRVGRRLVELAERWGQEMDEAIVIAISISQEEIGAWSGVSREATVKTLAEFRDRGWIETGRRWIRVLDLEALRRRSRWPPLGEEIEAGTA